MNPEAMKILPNPNSAQPHSLERKTAMTDAQIIENEFVKSLESQLKVSDNTAGQLAITSGDSSLDQSLVSRLQDSGVLVLRSENEALSKTLEDGPLADAIAWSVSEAGVTKLTLVGHSRAATIEGSDQATGLVARARLHNERLAASKLKLKDDVARFVNNSQISSLISENGLKIDALFYLRESDSFLTYDHGAEKFSAV